MPVADASHPSGVAAIQMACFMNCIALGGRQESGMRHRGDSDGCRQQSDKQATHMNDRHETSILTLPYASVAMRQPGTAVLAVAIARRYWVFALM